MNDQSRHPLSPEERALAARLARLGPQGDPSPALDAKILAAARAAATAPQSRRRRRFVLSGLPASLITAAGTAAALVLAVGVVWQLRPADRPPLPRDTASGTSDDGFVIAEIVTPRPAANAAGSPSAAPAATLPSQRQMVVSPREATPGGMPSRRSTPATVPVMTSPVDSRATASTAGASHAAPPPAVSAAAPPHALESVEVTGSRIPARAGSDASDAFAGEEHTHSRSETEAAAGAADSAEPRHASYTTAALAKAERASRARQGGTAAQSSPAAASTESAATASAPLAGIPVDVDAKLPPAEWLHRIRERRDQGDLAGARNSLRRFREVYPGARIPFDLRRLLR